MPNLYIIAGCNGAGKTTAAAVLLSDVFHTDIFINADNIAATLNPRKPEIVAMKAGRMMLEQIQYRLSRNQTFAIETTLATRTYLNLIRQAQLSGYEVIMHFLYLPSVEMAIERVKLRVSKGGHDIPSDVIERRYHTGIKYFFEYIKRADRWYFYENKESLPVIIARGEMPDTILIYNFELWEQLKNK